MTREEITEYLYEINTRADYSIEDIADDLTSAGFAEELIRAVDALQTYKMSEYDDMVLVDRKSVHDLIMDYAVHQRAPVTVGVFKYSSEQNSKE